MKTVLVVSDTHGNYDLLQHVLDSNILADVIIHLGDNYEDLDNCVYNRRGRKVYRVPGIFHKDYRNGSLPHTLDIEIDGWNLHIAHSPDDLTHSADAMLFGHTHNWECANSIWGLMFNPGHLRAAEDKGRIATYGIIDVYDDKMTCKILNIQHKIIAEATLEKQ
ncbi:MAG: metallophosphoesterase family protein [Candidatus Cloacimonetes bacterium]|nr:metallophosphoesterase family protein [Candidatus Cloacimonadota bacterium]